MPDDATRRLRELHDRFIWETNAAVAEGRTDLLEELSDEFLALSLAVMGGEPPVGPVQPVQRRSRWRRFRR